MTFLRCQHQDLSRRQRFAANFSTDIQAHRAEFMYDSLVYAFDCMAARFHKMCQYAFLRSLRFKVLERRSRRLYNRAKLKKWLRICVRYRYFLKGMDRFNRMRTKYVGALRGRYYCRSHSSTPTGIGHSYDGWSGSTTRTHCCRVTNGS